jgi:hypothetical protein
MHVRLPNSPQRTTAGAATAGAAGRPAVLTLRTPRAHPGEAGAAPAERPALTASDAPQVLSWLAGTDDDELPLFGRFPA